MELMHNEVSFAASQLRWPRRAIDPDRTFAVLISPPQSRRSDPHTGLRCGPRA